MWKLPKPCFPKAFRTGKLMHPKQNKLRLPNRCFTLQCGMADIVQPNFPFFARPKHSGPERRCNRNGTTCNLPPFLSHAATFALGATSCIQFVCFCLPPNLPVQNAGATETEQTATCPIFVSHCNVACWLTLCKLSVFLAQNIAEWNAGATETEQATLFAQSLFHAAMGAALCTHFFRFACPKPSGPERCCKRNGTNCNLPNPCSTMPC